MKPALTIFTAIGVVLAVFAVTLWQKSEALAYLAQNGEIDDWQFFGHPIAPTRSIPRWLPGVWPRSLAINAIPLDTKRYVAAVRRLPGLDMIMVFVYEPMSIDIFTALGSVSDVKRLDLTSTSVSDSAFQKFMQFATVEELFLDFSAITDVSMEHILKFRNVRELEIYQNSFSGPKVLELARLPALRIVSLDERLSPDTVAALQAQRPDLTVNQ